MNSAVFPRLISLNAQSLFLVILALFSFVGCDDKDKYEISALVLPQQMDFGAVPLDQMAVRPFSVFTDSDKVLKILSVTSSNPDFSVIEPPRAQGISGEQLFTLVFRPSRVGPSVSTISIEVALSNNSKAQKNLTIKAVGSGIKVPAPILFINKSRLNFGNVTVGSEITQNVVISNTGTLPLNVSVALDTTRSKIFSFEDPEQSPEFSLAPHSTQTLTLKAKPTAAILENTVLSITSNGGKADVSLLALGVDGPNLSIDGQDIDFGEVQPDSTGWGSLQKSILIHNTGTKDLTFLSFSLSNSIFQIVSTPTTIAPQSEGTVVLRFFSNTIGDAAGQLSINSNGGFVSLNLRAKIKSGKLSFNPSPLNFGPVRIGEMKDLNLHINNTGNSELSLLSMGFYPISAAPFSIASGSNLTSIPANESRTLKVRFAPTTSGMFSHDLRIETNIGTVAVTLHGSGTAQAGLQPSTPIIDLGSVLFHEDPSATLIAQAQTSFVVTNTSLSKINVTGTAITNPSFTISGLPASFNPGESRTITLNFETRTAGYITGMLTINSDSGTLNINLIASADYPILTLDPETLDFGTKSLGTTNTALLRFENTGSGQLNIESARIVGGPAFTMAPLGFSFLYSGENRAVPITFNPVTPGEQSALIIVRENQTEHYVTLRGNGGGTTTVTVAPNLINFATIDSGQAAVQTVTLTNTSASMVQINSITANDPNVTTGNLTASLLNPNASASFQIHWSPLQTGQINDTVTINTTAGNFTVYLIGTAR